MATKQQGSFRPACRVEAEGDTWIDDHHTNEDIALALGTALSQVGSVEVLYRQLVCRLCLQPNAST